MGEFGDKFRKAREQRGISLDEVASVTKISSRMLRAIEQERFDQLPGGVFNKGFIRAYAKQVGLNDDEAVAEYLECLRQKQEGVQEIWEPRSEPHAPAKPGTQSQEAVEELPDLQLPRAEHVRPPRQEYTELRDSGIPWGILAVAALVIVLAVLLWHRHSRHTGAGSAGAASSVASPSVANPAPASQATGPGLSPQQTPIRNAGQTPQSAPPRTAPTPAAKQSGQITSSAAPIAAEPAAKPLGLVIRASENSWISVTADGNPGLHEMLIAPAHLSVRASREIVLKVGNAAGVTFLWNGQEIPAQGSEGEVQTLAFDASGMRVVPPTPPPAQNP